MSLPNDERPELTREDEEFVKRVAASYAPPPMAPAERAAFDEALLGRIRQGHPARRRLVLAGLPAAAAAALAAVWLLFLSPGTERLAPSEETVPALSARAWEEELFLEGGSFEAEQLDESDLLPEEYIAIASVFMDG
jgi:type II secretory pathway component PulM